MKEKKRERKMKEKWKKERIMNEEWENKEK